MKKALKPILTILFCIFFLCTFAVNEDIHIALQVLWTLGNMTLAASTALLMHRLGMLDEE